MMMDEWMVAGVAPSCSPFHCVQLITNSFYEYESDDGGSQYLKTTLPTPFGFISLSLSVHVLR